ncbi:MAG: SIS domain-containing protein [Candidatus Omnitrophica bacterium]|nr:SIS domain-containing protein [Candidatus Omnitrophota bacterium]
MDIKQTIKNIAEESLRAKKDFFLDERNIGAVSSAAEALLECYERGAKVIVFGNGGSAADSQHFAAELMVRFEKERKALPVIALTTDTSILTATANDYSFEDIFSRQIDALGNDLDVAVAISTSGNSKNVLKAVRAARRRGIKVIALTASGGGELAGIANISISVNEKNTARIQEVHIVIIHILSKLVENSIAG